MKEVNVSLREVNIYLAKNNKKLIINYFPWAVFFLRKMLGTWYGPLGL